MKSRTKQKETAKQQVSTYLTESELELLDKMRIAAAKREGRIFSRAEILRSGLLAAAKKAGIA